MSDLKDLILSRISNAPRSSVWTVDDFLALGSYNAVRKTLQRLALAGEVRRIHDGLYDKPQINRLTKKDDVPDPRLVVDAVARRNQIRVLVDGMTAANDLGLTNAVPAKIIIHTDARLRPIKLGNLKITFKTTTPSKLFWTGRPAMRLVQALHWLRDVLAQEEESVRVKSILTRLFEDDTYGAKISDDLISDLSVIPIWMQEFLRPLLRMEAPPFGFNGQRGEDAIARNGKSN